jgi:response regulator RpfG family c-di-GMP phosphodiesterase
MTLNLKRTNILVLDDEFDIVVAIKHSLQKSGFNVFGFTNPFLALEYFKLNCKNCSLILSDIRMPGMNGFEFVKKIKAIKKEAKVLLMTAFEIKDSEFSRIFPSSKVDGFIQKPITLKELNKTIENHTTNITIDEATKMI